jgi:hypothetical protein
MSTDGIIQSGQNAPAAAAVSTAASSSRRRGNGRMVKRQLLADAATDLFVVFIFISFFPIQLK